MKRPDLTRRLRGLGAVARPRGWPIRWRLAAVSAGLTLIILIAFALIVGRLATDRLKSDFRDELEQEAGELAEKIELTPEILQSPFGSHFSNTIQYSGPDLEAYASANDAAVRLVYSNGLSVRTPTPEEPDLGPPVIGIERVGEFDVVTLPVARTISVPAAFVQYGRERDDLEATVNRLWLLLAAGALVGTMMATLAGLAVASRAMRPVAALTTAAREIASTRDPSRRIPEPERDDEVAELARTLDDMLRQLDAARGETQQMIQSQREFIADASHELRTPLTSILANLELLQEHLDVAERGGEQGEMVESALASSKRMRRLIGDLLLLARADAGRRGARREVDLARTAAAALAEVRPVADGHRIELAADAETLVEGDPDELHRLAVNLLDNGVRHTPQGTRIRIAVRREGGDAVLEVSDGGPGIPVSQREQIFSRFARLGGPGDVLGSSGTGLGLAIVRAVVDSHGGTVEVGSSPAGGARFTVRLPAYAPAPQAGRSGSAAAAAESGMARLES